MTIAATSTLGIIVSVVAIVTSGLFVATILRYRDDPTTRPLIGLAVTLLVGVLLHLAIVDLAPVREALGIQGGPTDSIGGFWILIAFDLPAVVSGFWFLFALQYTGRDRQTSPIAYSAIVVLLVLLVAPSVALALLGSTVDVSTSTLNTVLGITIVLAESLALVGLFLVVATTIRHKAFPPTQTGLLTIAIGSILALPFAATTLQHTITTPVAIIGSSVLFTTTLRRYRVFETLPVASVIGREQVIDEMSEGVVMVGEDGRIRDLNARAETVLGIESSTVRGEPVGDVVPALSDPTGLAETGPQDVRVDAGRILRVTADTITDDRGREFGHLLVCRDVTDERRRERRLGLLTQLVADATRDQMGQVRDVADQILSGDSQPARGGERITETATHGATLVAHVRDVEQALAAPDSGRAHRADVLEVVRDVAERTDISGAVGLEGGSIPVAANPDLLRATIETLLSGVGAAADSADLYVTEEGEQVTVGITPFDVDGSGLLPSLTLEIANLAARDTTWLVEEANETVQVKLTRAARNPSESAGDET